MANFQVSMPNAAEFRRRIERKRAGVETEVKNEMKTMADATLKMLKGTLAKNTSSPRSFTVAQTVSGRPTQPVHVERGTVRRSLNKGNSENIFEVKGYSATVGSKNKVMGYLEYGTRAHGPRKAKFLRFGTPGGVVFTKWVKGIRPMKIFAIARTAMRRILPARIKLSVRRGLSK